MRVKKRRVVILMLAVTVLVPGALPGLAQESHDSNADGIVEPEEPKPEIGLPDGVPAEEPFGDWLTVAWSASNSRVFRFDDVSGAFTFVGFSGFKRLNSLARNRAGELYSVESSDGVTEGALVKIDPDSGVGTMVVELMLDIRGLAFSPDDQLYAIRNQDGSPQLDELVTIDITSGTRTPIGFTRLRALQSLAFSPSGVLYAWDSAGTGYDGIGLVTLDSSTGAATDVSPSVSGELPGRSLLHTMQSIAFDPQGRLIGLSYEAGSDYVNETWEIDPSTGIPTPLASTLDFPYGMRGIEFSGGTPPFGACCIASNSAPLCVEDLTQGACEAENGLFAGPGTDCVDPLTCEILLSDDWLAVAWSASDSRVYRFNDVSGAFTFVGFSGFDRLNSLARNRAGELYSVASTDGFSDGAVITIDPDSGAGTLVVELTPVVIYALAFSPQDELYAIQEPGFISELVTIDITSGARTPIGRTGLTSLTSLAFSPSGVLYGWDAVGGIGLVTLDPATGAATDVNPGVSGELPGRSFLHTMQSIAFDPHGRLIGLSYEGGAVYVNETWDIDPSTGIPTSLASTMDFPYGMRGLESIASTPPLGACCIAPNSARLCVEDLTQDACEAERGLFAGPGTDCADPLTCATLLVTLDALTATAVDGGVQVRWITAAEIDTAGFRVLRESARRGKAIELVAEVAAAGSALEGHAYTVLDDDPEAARARRYYLEDVDVYGKVTRHGPIVVQRGTRRAQPARDTTRQGPR